MAGLVAAIATSPTSVTAAPAATVAAETSAGPSVADFYAVRDGRPLFLAPGNETAVRQLLSLLALASTDGLDPKRYKVRALEREVRRAERDPAALRRAELALANAFTAYARDLRTRTPDLGVIYVDGQLRTAVPTPRMLLEAAAREASLDRHLRAMAWMHPYYAPLREELLQARDPRRRDQIAVNLERVRLLPGAASGRYVLVNAAAQRLFMIENGQPVDTMRVVVGKPEQPTPMMAALIRYTSLNPYWNVPADLAAERVAPFVVKEGLGYLRRQGYQLLSDWSDRAQVMDPASVDWREVAAGRKEVRLRQLPGPANSMGDMKFMFPNAQGIYLHDTPSTELFSEASRLFSGGCVRLEAAPRLARWLYGRPVRAKGARPEQKLPLPEPVPVYLTYLTTVPSGGGELAIYDDIYGHDARRLAELTRRERRPGQLAGR